MVPYRWLGLHPVFLRHTRRQVPERVDLLGKLVLADLPSLHTLSPDRYLMEDVAGLVGSSMV